MDLDLYQQLVRRYWPVFLAVVGLTVIAAWLFVSRATASPVYLGSQFIGVAQRPQADVERQYQFGEFYSFQGSAFLAEFLASWLQDPATVQRVFSAADLPVPSPSLRSLGRFYDLKLRGRSGFQVTLERTDPDEARSLLLATTDVLTTRLADLKGQGLYPDAIMVPGEIAVGPTLPNLPLNLALGAIAGVFLGGVALLALSLTLPRKT